MTVFVISKYGEQLMPTTRCGKVRHMLDDGRAVIASRNPFTIQLAYETTTYTQPIELTMDTGYEHIGISVKSEAKEYVSEQYDLPKNEKQRHDSRRMYRRNRRSRKRYRAPRYDNRRASKKEGWLAPSIRHKMEAHVRIAEKYIAVAPIKSMFVEVGQFDPAKLKAIEEGEAVPEGKDYQQGPRYMLENLREAVLVRDNFTCCFCGRSPFKDGAVLYVHHALYWKGRHGNSVSELATICEKCHTPANHKESGKLWGYEPKAARLEGAAFMNIVRRRIVDELKKLGVPVCVTYGADTKAMRHYLGLEKSHANDAYAMGEHHPKERAETVVYRKRRRNNRRLERFYDAKYYDTRLVESEAPMKKAMSVLKSPESSKGQVKAAKKTLEKAVKSGQELFSGRSKRNKNLSAENLHPYRGPKKSKGRRAIRKRRYLIRPGDTVLYKGNTYSAVATHSNGHSVMLENGKSVSINKAALVRHCCGWAPA